MSRGAPVTARTSSRIERPVVKIEITNGAHTVAVEAREPLTTVKRAALDLYRSTGPAKVPTGGAMGFQSDRDHAGDAGDALPPGTFSVGSPIGL